MSRRGDEKGSVRVQVQPDLFGGPEVVYGLRRGKKKAPATVTSSPGAVTNDQRGIESAANLERLPLRRQAER